MLLVHPHRPVLAVCSGIPPHPILALPAPQHALLPRSCLPSADRYAAASAAPPRNARPLRGGDVAGLMGRLRQDFKQVGGGEPGMGGRAGSRCGNSRAEKQEDRNSSAGVRESKLNGRRQMPSIG